MVNHEGFTTSKQAFCQVTFMSACACHDQMSEFLSDEKMKVHLPSNLSEEQERKTHPACKNIHEFMAWLVK